eukprot:m.117418 g.117418  ORF g.117418 m.117418 type:complete len:1285 (-) comp28579_c0_seq1:26-3880(-)
MATFAMVKQMAKAMGYGNFAMFALKQLRRMYAKSFVGRHQYKFMLVALALNHMRGKKLAAKKKAKREKERIAKGLPRPPKDPKKTAINDMWGYLLPKKFSNKSLDGAGSYEIGSMVLLCLSRVWLMNVSSNLVGALDANMLTRNQTDFWRLFRYTLVHALGEVFHRTTYIYTENRLAKVWCKKLTTIAHGLYFKDMNYYQISQLSAVKGEFKDVDARLSEDIQTVSKEMTHVLCEGVYASTAGMFFAWKLSQLYGPRYALAPYVYLWGAISITGKLAPVPWSKLIGSIREKFSAYRRGLSRLMTHQEAILAMKGTTIESEKIKTRYQILLDQLHGYNVTCVWHGFVNQLGFLHWLRTFVGIFVFGPHVYYPSVTDLSTLENVSQLRGTIGHEFVLFVQSLIAAGLTGRMLRQLQKVAGSAGRVNEMIEKFKSLSKQRKTQKRVEADDGDFIQFKDVEVKTPTGITLVEKLNFTLKRGETLLLTGHNGAGKSSIFRCLGGLWTIEKGSIVKPGGGASGLHNDVFFLPQKPYNVLGTLPEQLTYPGIKDGEKPLEEAEVREILSKVDLEYLLERENVMTAETHWEEALSLGEKQRLAIARLIYHKPQYAILDECTSAVSGAMERTLYRVCKEMNITYITISHRPVLRAFHDRLLTIGLGEHGYEMEDIDHSQLNESETLFSQVTKKSQSPSTLQPAHKKKDVAKGKSTTPKRPIGESIWRLLSMAYSPAAAWKSAGIVVALVLEARFLLLQTIAAGGMMGAVLKQDKKLFVSVVKTHFFRSFQMAVVEQALLYMQRELRLDLQSKVTNNLLDRLFKNGNFYKLVQFDRQVMDPEQRIAEDLRDLSETTSQIFAELLKPCLEITLFASTLANIVGTDATLALLAYFVGGFTIIRYTLPNFKRIVAEEAKQEGIFKNFHARVKTHAESIAFFGGEKRELAVVDGQHDKLFNIQMQKLSQSYNFDLINQAIVRKAPMLVQWLLRNTYGQRCGTDEEVVADRGVTLNSNQVLIYEAVVRSFDSMGQLLAFVERFAKLSGLIERVVELDDALLRVERGDVVSNVVTPIINSPEAIEFDSVNVTTPAGQELTQALSFQLPRNESLMVTGPNAVGKTSLFRVLAGLWPAGNGTVKAPCENGVSPSLSEIFLVSQRLYMAEGTLAEQITYPIREKMTPGMNTHLQSLLDLVGVGYLTDRYDWDSDLTWEDVLSLGEQQRIGMARLFFHNPRFGVLDECTSAISVDIEQRLYAEAAKRNISCITMSQRLALDEFHDQELQLDSGELGWSLNRITK